MPAPLVNDHVLLPILADWEGNNAVGWSLKWDTETVTALRGNEGRNALRRLPRTTLSVPYVAPTPGHAAVLLTGLREALRSRRACCPLYGRGSVLAADVGVGARALPLEPFVWSWAAGDWLIVFGDTLDHYAVARVDAVSDETLNLVDPLGLALDAGSAVYPLFFGRPDAADDATLLSGDVSAGTLRMVREDFAPVPRALTLYAGRPVWTAPHEWSAEPQRGLSYNAREQKIGFGAPVAEPLSLYAASRFSTRVDLPDAAAVADLEGFFQHVFGRLRGFWLASPDRAAVIVGPGAGPGQVVIAAQGLADTWQDHPAQHLCFRRPGEADVYARITAVAAAGDGQTEIITLDPAPAAALDEGWDAGWLHYVRLVGDELKIDLVADHYGSAELKSIELPIEYTSVEAGDRPAFLYRFFRPGGPGVRWTSFPERVFGGTEALQTAWEPVPITHGELTRSTKGDAEKVEITAWRGILDSPLDRWFPFPRAYDLCVEIGEVDLAGTDPGRVTPLFSGVVDTVKVKGKALTVACTTRLDRMDARLPRFKVQKGCNYCLYDPYTCKVPRADWAVAATVAAVAPGGRALTLAAAGIGARAADWFQWGDLETVDADGLAEYTLVAGSAQAGADAIVVQLHSPPSLVPAVGAAVKVAAGCNLDFFSEAGCRKFGNQANFGGHPHIDENLTIKQVVSGGDGGKGGGK